VIKLSRKECLILIVCVVLPAGGYGISHFVLHYSWRGMILLTLVGIFAALLILGLSFWRGEKKNKFSG